MLASAGDLQGGGGGGIGKGPFCRFVKAGTPREGTVPPLSCAVPTCARPGGLRGRRCLYSCLLLDWECPAPPQTCTDLPFWMCCRVAAVCWQAALGMSCDQRPVNDPPHTHTRAQFQHVGFAGVGLKRHSVRRKGHVRLSFGSDPNTCDRSRPDSSPWRGIGSVIRRVILSPDVWKSCSGQSAFGREPFRKKSAFRYCKRFTVSFWHLRWGLRTRTERLPDDHPRPHPSPPAAGVLIATGVSPSSDKLPQGVLTDTSPRVAKSSGSYARDLPGIPVPCPVDPLQLANQVWLAGGGGGG